MVQMGRQTHQICADLMFFALDQHIIDDPLLYALNKTLLIY